MNRPSATFLPDLYRFIWPEEGIQVDVEQPHGERGGLSCVLRVETSRAPVAGLLSEARFNLSSLPTRKQWQRALEERMPGIDWGAALEQVCKLSNDQYRRGEPVVDLRTLEPKAGPLQLVQDLVEDDGATIGFGDGGSGKSTLAEALAVSVASGEDLLAARPSRRCPVLILDWETNADAHGDLFRAICAGADLDPLDVPVHYQRMSASLVDAAQMIRRKIAELGVGFVIVDSLGAARNGEPESAETTIRLFNAARSLGVPWFGVDHVPKNGTDKSRPFGSTYTHNLARRTWGIVKASEEGSNRLTIALTNHKANNGRIARRRGYHLDFEEDEVGRPLSIRFTPCDVRDVPAFVGRMTLKDQLLAVLRQNNGAMTVEDIAAALEADGVALKDSVIRAVLNRHKDTFSAVPDGRTTRWGLLSRAFADGQRSERNSVT